MNTDSKRNEILQKAQEKYIDTGYTKNITEALRLYLENDAGPDEQVPLFISSPVIHQIRKVLEEFRPRCDECDTELHLQVGAVDPTGRTYPTTWKCRSCGIEIYSDKSPEWWLKELQDEARKQNIRRTDEPGSGKMPPGRKGP